MRYKYTDIGEQNTRVSSAQVRCCFHSHPLMDLRTNQMINSKYVKQNR